MGTGINQPSDEDLIARLQTRDTDAFALLYDRYSRMAFGLAYRLLEDPAAAEDAVQEAFLSVWRQAATFRAERSAVRTWLLSIVHHKAIDRLRRTRTQEIAGGIFEDLPERVDESVNIEHQVGTAQDAKQVREALEALPPDQRRAIELAYFAGHSHSEIARLLDIPIGTVKGRLRIGLQKMKNLLDTSGLQGATHDA